MPTLNGRPVRGAFIDDGGYTLDGVPTSLLGVLQYLNNNLGGAGTDDITEAPGNPSGDPGSGPGVYQNTTNGSLWIWNGTTWVQLQSAVEITLGSGNPSTNPGAGPRVYQNTTNGSLWLWNGTAWVQIPTSLEITLSAGNPSGNPGAGPRVYQNTTNGSLWIWNGTTWVQLQTVQAALPAYDNEAAARLAGLNNGDRWKYTAGNTDGMPKGVVVEL